MVSGKTKAMSKISLKNLLVTVKGEFHIYIYMYIYIYIYISDIGMFHHEYVNRSLEDKILHF